MNMRFALALVMLGGCVPGSGKDQRKTGNAPGEQSAQAPRDPEIEELGATDPVSIAGVNLIADYHNTRARCDFKNTAGENYEIYCRVTITTELGREFLPLRTKASLQLAWQTPVQTRGDFRLERCQESADHLSFQCQGQLRSGTSALDFPLLISDSTLQASRKETSEVLLPYFVGVIEGDFSDTHRSYTQLPDPTQEQKPVQAGFFRSEVNRLDHKVNVQDACEHGDLVVMASPTYLYIYDGKKDEIKPIAGRFDENVRFSYRFEDPLRLNHQTYRLACGPDGFTSYHASSGWDVDANGQFTASVRTLRFNYNGQLLRAVDTLTDQVSGRVAQIRSNRNLSNPGPGRQRVASVANFDGEYFQLIDVIKTPDSLQWISTSYAPDQAQAISTRTLETLDLSAGDVITPGLADPSVLARFVRDRPEVLLYSGYCHYNLYSLKEARQLGELGPRKSALSAPSSCLDDTVIPGREFARFGANSFIMKVDNENFRVAVGVQPPKAFVSGTLALPQEPLDLLKQGIRLAFDGRVPQASRVYPLAGERLLVTNMEYLGLIQSGSLRVLSANNRLRAPEVGRINSIFWEAATGRILRISNKTVGASVLASIEELQKESFVPLLEVPCSAIVGTGPCAEFVYKTGGGTASFFITSPGANGSSTDRSDLVTYDAKTQLVTTDASYATPRAYRYRNSRADSLASRLILRHESQSTFMLFNARTGVSTPISLPTATYMDSSSVYAINEVNGTLDLLVANSFESDASKSFSFFHMDLNSPSSQAPQMGFVSVPPPASTAAVLPYAAPQDGLDFRLNMGFQANAKAIDQQSNLYFYFQSGLYMAPRSSSKLVKLLDLESAPDCGGQSFQGAAREAELERSVKASVRNLCYNKTDGIFVANGCNGRQGFLNILIRQYYGSESANLTLITAPCSLLP